jgi:hypothetical protein
LQAFTDKGSFRYDSVNKLTVPGMKMDNKTKFTELLNKTVKMYDVLINKSIPVSELIVKDMTLTRFLNESLTVGELIDTTYINDIIKSEKSFTLKQIFEMTESIRTVLDETVTLGNLLDTSISVKNLVLKNLPISQVLNATLKAEIPLDDTFLLHEFIDNNIRMDTVINKTIFIYNSFEYFELFNASTELGDIFGNDSIFFLLRDLYKTVIAVNDSIKEINKSVNAVTESANNLNMSNFNQGNQSEETIQRLEDIINKLDTIKSIVPQIGESTANLEFGNITMNELVNETLKVIDLTNKTLKCFSDITGFLEQMFEFVSNQSALSELVGLNQTFEVSSSLCALLKTKVEKLLSDTITLSDIIIEENNDSDTQILELIGRNIKLGDLFASSIYLKDVLHSSVTLQELEMAGNKVWTYLDKNLQIYDIINDRGNSVNLVDILVQSDKTKRQALKPNHYVPVLISDSVLVKTFVSYLNHSYLQLTIYANDHAISFLVVLFVP